jgi:hypothetical protein
MLRGEEKLVFAALCQAHPEFAGVMRRWEEGPDPPDFIGTDPMGRRIGVELGEWLNQEQMRQSKLRERIEDSFLAAIRSENEEPPQHVGHVWLSLKEERVLPAEEATQFRDEILDCIRAADIASTGDPEWDSPQGHNYSDFSSFPSLQRYLTGLRFWSARRRGAYKGIAWVGFPSRGGPYTPKSAVDALLELLIKKTKKYADLYATANLDKLYLVVYWNQGLIYNTPFFAPGFGFQEIARLAAESLAGRAGPFQKILLFNALPQDLDLAQLHP